MILDCWLSVLDVHKKLVFMYMTDQVSSSTWRTQFFEIQVTFQMKFRWLIKLLVSTRLSDLKSSYYRSEECCQSHELRYLDDLQRWSDANDSLNGVWVRVCLEIDWHAAMIRCKWLVKWLFPSRLWCLSDSLSWWDVYVFQWLTQLMRLIKESFQWFQETCQSISRWVAR